MRRIAIVISIMLLMSSMTSFGAQVDDLKKKLNDAKGSMKNAQQELKANKKEQGKVADKIESLNNEINRTEQEIDRLFSQIMQTKGEISIQQKEMKRLQELIEAQKELLKKRLRVMYKTSDIDYMEVLLSSTDISEFMSNLDMIKRIAEHDKELIEQFKNDREKVEKVKQGLEQKEKMLADLQRKAESEKTKLAVSRGQQVEYKQELEQSAEEIEAEIDKFNEYARSIQSQITKLQSSSASYGGGAMAWPSAASTRVTSPFGYRNHPILKKQKFHSGIDIGAPSGSNVLAANDGTVIFAGWQGGYGNTVMIDHGGKIVTLYGHNSRLLVGTGDKVTRGQVIAKCGSTGLSTGPHIHFEVRKNGSPVDPMGWVR